MHSGLYNFAFRTKNNVPIEYTYGMGVAQGIYIRVLNGTIDLTLNSI